MGCGECGEILNRVLAELREIRRALPRPRRLAPADFELLKRLVPAWGGKWGSRAVTARRILRDPVLSELCGNCSPGRLGCVLSKWASDDTPVAGIVVERMETQHGRRWWRLAQVVSRLPENATKTGLKCSNMGGGKAHEDDH